MSGHTLWVSWPILRPGMSDAALIAEATADLGVVAYGVDARVTGPAVVWVDRPSNRVRAWAPARPRRVRRRDDDSSAVAA